MKRGLVHSLIIAIIICLVGSLTIPWNNYLTDLTSLLLFKLRGPRQLTDEIIICRINAQDIDSDSTWNLSRDHYSDFVRAFSGTNIRAIGIDMLFNQADTSDSATDSTFAATIQSSRRVILPMVFQDLISNDQIGDKSAQFHLQSGVRPEYPIEPFRTASAGIGFSNLGDDKPFIKIPLIVETEHDTLLSFGVELARLYMGWGNDFRLDDKTAIFKDVNGRDHDIPLDKRGYLRLNHIGGIDEFTSVSFSELLKFSEIERFSQLVENRMIILTVSGPASSGSYTTPYGDDIPASLIHATLADNLINNSMIALLPPASHFLIIILMALLGFLAWHIERKRIIFVLMTAIFCAYAGMVYTAFTRFNLLIPIFYPIVCFVFTALVFALDRTHSRFLQEEAISDMLTVQVDKKMIELIEVKKTVKELREHIRGGVKISQNMLNLAEQREKEVHRLEKQLSYLKSYSFDARPQNNMSTTDIIYSNTSVMAQVMERVAQVSSDNMPVLLVGEPGTGKERIARAIHETSPRKNAPFWIVNCGALPEKLLNCEIFGYEKHILGENLLKCLSSFERIPDGTIYLDEITESSVAFQAQLANVIRQGAFERIGGKQPSKITSRIIIASAKDLQEEVKKMRFRSDLFSSVKEAMILIPPLRERIEDIPVLALNFLKKHTDSDAPAFSGDAIDIMQHYRWPGNVRELEIIILRAARLAKNQNRTVIKETDLPTHIKTTKSKTKPS